MEARRLKEKKVNSELPSEGNEKMQYRGIHVITMESLRGGKPVKYDQAKIEIKKEN
ncbi:hypothetical protein LL037_05700 [Clostridium estertheticum]|uniref:hypothetical protein n=1 Tax=Clostridium estertheticum TaxID=238834 RepID=UPI001C0B4AB1|nr:hypothetical protein [Clostridium estertheticum]MBU3202415.1 hypothetical protein [Clostridium estertheticum]WAG66626.1 hypothetical protein LL037_05700 [Clostridium estertheticum]